jgi:hypothetical protein
MDDSGGVISYVGGGVDDGRWWMKMSEGERERKGCTCQRVYDKEREEMYIIWS